MVDPGKHLDLDVLDELKVVMGDDFPLLIETFVGDSGPRLEQIGAAIASGDADALRRSAHSFKGSAGNMGARELAALCQQLESLGRDGRVDGAAGLLDAARREYRLVCDALDAMGLSGTG